MKIELWCQFCKCIHVVGSTIRVLSFPCQPTLLPPTALSSLILDYLFSLFFIFFLPFLVLSHSFLSIIFYHYHNPLLSPSRFATLVEAQAFLMLGLRLCLSSGSCSGVSWFRIAGLSSWQHRRWILQSSLSVSLSWEWSLMENTCLYRIQNICSGKINGSTSFAIDNMYYVNFRMQK